VIVKPVDHPHSLPRCFLDEFRTVVIAPLQSEILPDQHTFFIALRIEGFTLNVRMDTDGVDVRVFHQFEIEPQLRGRHLRKPLARNVVRPSQKDRVAV
jgi:hypothetical protein